MLILGMSPPHGAVVGAVQSFFPNLNDGAFSKLSLRLMLGGVPGVSHLGAHRGRVGRLWAVCVWHWGWVGLPVSLSASSPPQGLAWFPVHWQAALGHLSVNHPHQAETTSAVVVGSKDLMLPDEWIDGWMDGGGQGGSQPA